VAVSAGEAGGWLRAGRIGRPHGLDGSFHVAGASASLLVVGREVRLGEDGSVRRIERRAGHDARVILRLDGYASREAITVLRGLELFVPRSAAPPLGEDEWWAEELEGCAVHDAGRPVGVVARLLGLPSCEVLEVTRVGADGEDGSAAEPLLVPLVGDAVRSVDVAARRIDIDLRFLGEA
jgi:16S rRNA processing protein RimM